MTTPWGSYPSSGWTKVIDTAVPGTDYQYSTPNFSGSVPRLSVSATTSPVINDDYLLETEYTITEGLTHGDSYSASGPTTPRRTRATWILHRRSDKL